MKHFKLLKGMLACLLSLALVFSCFEGVGLQAAETAAQTTVTAPTAVEGTYDPSKDTISTLGKVIYVLKKESGNTIKAGAKCYEVNTTKQDENTLAAIGVKGTTKDVYLYICDKQFEAEGTSIKANLVIKAQAAKKIVGVIDYTQADDPASTTVLSIKATTKDKKEIANPTLIWSEDGTTWKRAAEFTGDELVKKLEAGGGSIQVKMLGDEKTLTSKAIKVKIAKQGKAPAVKIDVKKDTFSIKNGMDYAIFTKSGDKYVKAGTDGWKTVLPYLKSAKIKGADSSIVNIGDYLPRDKKDTDAATDDVTKKVSYTQTKVKTLSYNTINELYVSASSGQTTETQYYIGVRTSATSKKPASAVQYIEYSPKTEAPIVYTESCVSGQYLISSGNDFTKKGLTLSTIANYNGENGTEGFSDSFKLKQTAGSGADTNSAGYEYTIVKYSDIVDSGSGANIDWTSVSWKKLDPAKTKINSKLKSKYLTTAGTKVTAELKAATISGEATADLPSDIQTVMLVRRAGIKGSALASNYQVLYVAKKGSETGIYSTKSVGEEAWKYTIKFAKYEAPSTSSSGGWTVASDIAEVSVWLQTGDAKAKYVELPKVEGADLFTATATGSGSGMTITASSSGAATEAGGDNKGKYKVTLSTSGDVVEYIAVKEYANIKVVAAGSGETVPEKEIGLVKAGKVSSVSGDKLNAGTNVTAYVGEQITIGVLDYAAPTGYALSGSGAVTATGTGYTGAALADNTVTVTVNTADEVTVTVTYPVVKTYTIKFDLNGQNATAIGNKETGADGKIEAPTAPKVAGQDFGGWFTNKECSGDVVDFTKAFTADTTLYAKWTATPAQGG